MRLSNDNVMMEKWYKLSQNESDVITINSGDIGILKNDGLPNKFFTGSTKIRFVNSVVNGSAGLTVGNGLSVAQIGVWQPVVNSGFIRFQNIGDDFQYEYIGNYPIEIGEFEIGYSPINFQLFSQPIDFTPPITVPPSSRTTVSMSDGEKFVMGDYTYVVSGGGRLKEVVVDMIKDPRKDAGKGTPYIIHKSDTTTTSQSIMFNNAVFNKSIYTTADGVGTIVVNSGFTGLRFRIQLTPDTWAVEVMFATNGSGQMGTIDNKVNGGSDVGEPALEYLVFNTITY